MSQENKPDKDEMSPEYDIRDGARGKYYERYETGSNAVVLDPDVAAIFRDSQSVNHALRLLIDVAKGEAGRG